MYPLIQCFRLIVFISGSKYVHCNLKGQAAATPVLSSQLILWLLSFAEYAESIGDGKSDEFKETERKRIMDLVDNF